MTTYINKADGTVVKQIPLDKERLKEVIDNLIFASVFVKDQSDLHYSLNATITLFEEIQNCPKGTLLELI